MANGRYYDKNGYVRVRINGKLVGEHRVIAEEMLGRPLRPGEVVHHRNGIKDDNRKENLEVQQNRDHARHHARERSVEMLTLTCPCCGREFERRASKVRWNKKSGATIYCSRKCAGRGSRPGPLR